MSQKVEPLDTPQKVLKDARQTNLPFYDAKRNEVDHRLVVMAALDATDFALIEGIESLGVSTGPDCKKAQERGLDPGKIRYVGELVALYKLFGREASRTLEECLFAREGPDRVHRARFDAKTLDASKVWLERIASKYATPEMFAIRASIYGIRLDPRTISIAWDPEGRAKLCERNPIN